MILVTHVFIQLSYYALLHSWLLTEDYEEMVEYYLRELVKFVLTYWL